ncbi:MAG: hypothetical protein C4530_19595 [Desulfobacteraceae bacterium]|nr:MAG: hypothetical protein C4530_19595 [Desulfobacteraceae bacterium]
MRKKEITNSKLQIPNNKTKYSNEEIFKRNQMSLARCQRKGLPGKAEGGDGGNHKFQFQTIR